MTREEILDQLNRLDSHGQHQWLIRLGHDLTISARAGYPVGDNPATLEQLIGFNELQHQLYNYLLGAKGNWSLESLLDVLFGESKRFGVEGDLGCAFRNSLRTIIGGETAT